MQNYYRNGETVAKGKVLSFEVIAYVLAIAKGLTFDVDTLLVNMYNVFANNAPATDIFAGIIAEIYDVALALGRDPAGTAINVGANVAGVWVTFKLLKMIFSALGVPRSKKIGDITVRWA